MMNPAARENVCAYVDEREWMVSGEAIGKRLERTGSVDMESMCRLHTHIFQHIN